MTFAIFIWLENKSQAPPTLKGKERQKSVGLTSGSARHILMDILYHNFLFCGLGLILFLLLTLI